jgi:glycerol-3-phosphate dehydrogenase (NAD(P)+)
VGTVAVMGAGSWGTAFACCATARVSASRCGPATPISRAHRATRRNDAYLPEALLPEDLRRLRRCRRGARRADLVVLAVPSVGLAAQLRTPGATSSRRRDHREPDEGARCDGGRFASAVVIDTLGCDPDRVVAVSGPNLAVEVAQGRPSATVAACPDLGRAQRVQAAVMAPDVPRLHQPRPHGRRGRRRREERARDRGRRAHGLGHGDNTAAFLITRGLAEMTRLGSALGADPLTFQGLAGVGDLVATCTSSASRNRTVGERLGRGERLEAIVASMDMVAEGVRTAPLLADLAERHDVDMPMVRAVVAVTRDGADIVTRAGRRAAVAPAALRALGSAGRGRHTMSLGLVLVLDGPSSVGKSTTLAALQRRWPVEQSGPLIGVGLDATRAALGRAAGPLGGPRRPGRAGVAGQPPRFRYGPLGRELVAGMHRAAAAWARSGSTSASITACSTRRCSRTCGAPATGPAAPDRHDLRPGRARRPRGGPRRRRPDVPPRSGRPCSRSTTRRSSTRPRRRPTRSSPRCSRSSSDSGGAERPEVGRGPVSVAGARGPASRSPSQQDDEQQRPIPIVEEHGAEAGELGDQATGERSERPRPPGEQPVGAVEPPEQPVGRDALAQRHGDDVPHDDREAADDEREADEARVAREPGRDDEQPDPGTVSASSRMRPSLRSSRSATRIRRGCRAPSPSAARRTPARSGRASSPRRPRTGRTPPRSRTPRS